MKKCRYSFFFVGILISLSLFSQDDKVNDENYQMLFPEFKQGIVMKKNGNRIKALLNYNWLKEELVFKKDDNTIWAVADPSDILIAIIDNRKFEYVRGNIFYERIPADSALFYVQWKVKIEPKGKPSPYGGYSKSSISDTRNVYHGNISVILDAEHPGDLVDISFLYMKEGNRFKKFDSPKSLSKLLGIPEKELKTYIQQNNMDLRNLENIESIIRHFKNL